MLYNKRLVKAYIIRQAPEIKKRLAVVLAVIALLVTLGAAGGADQTGYCLMNSYRCQGQ